MANTTWKQVVLDTADAYREANGTTDKIPAGQLADKVRAGAGIPYEGENPLTIGQDGYNFPAKTLLKDGLQIVNGVNGEDLTDTAADQTAAVAELLKMVNRKVAENNGIGEHVWKKYEADSTSGVFNFTQTTSGTPTVLQVSSSDIDLSKIDESAFVGLSGTVNATTYNFISEEHVVIGNSSWDWSYNPATAQITIQIDIASGTWQSATFEGVKIFVGYIVSDDESSFPDSGEQDGYWYELVVEGGVDLSAAGFTDVAVDVFTVSSNTDVTAKTLNHSLGKIPKIAYLIANKEPTTSKHVYYMVLGNPTQDGNLGGGIKVYGYGSTGNCYATATASTLKVTNHAYATIYYSAGKEYTLLTMA